MQHWSRKPANALIAAFLLMLLLFFPDKRTDQILERFSWLVIALAAVTDRYGSLTRRAIFVGILYFATAAFAVVFAVSSSAAAHGFRDAIVPLFKYQVWLLWAAVLWLSAPLFPFGKMFHPHRAAEQPSETASPSAQIAISALCLYTFIALLSAISGFWPKVSLRQISGELLPYAALTAIILRLFQPQDYNISDLPAARVAKRAAPALFIAVLISMLAVVALNAAGGAPAHWLQKHECIRIDPGADWTPKRLQFPFEHHNRAGYFCACVIFIALAAALASPRRSRSRIAWFAVAGLALVLLPFPMTRGAIIAAAVGIAVILIASLFARGLRVLWPVWLALLLSPLLWFALPKEHQYWIRSTIQNMSLKPAPGNTVGSRITLWQDTADMIRRHPLLGFGYGSEAYENELARDNPEAVAMKGSSHAHNLYLEIAAESGLIALAAFLVFTLARLACLIAAWLRARRAAAQLAWVLLVWLGLEAATLAYGFTNHPVRRNIGFFTFAIWATSLVLSWRSWRLGGKELEPAAPDLRQM